MAASAADFLLPVQSYNTKYPFECSFCTNGKKNLMRGIGTIEKRQADMIQNWAPVSADFYEGF